MALSNRFEDNCVIDPAMKNETSVGMIPIVLKIKGNDKIPTPIIVFIKIVTDRKRPNYDSFYLPWYERRHWMRPIRCYQRLRRH